MNLHDSLCSDSAVNWSLKQKLQTPHNKAKEELSHLFRSGNTRGKRLETRHPDSQYYIINHSRREKHCSFWNKHLSQSPSSISANSKRNFVCRRGLVLTKVWLAVSFSSKAPLSYMSPLFCWAVRQSCLFATSSFYFFFCQHVAFKLIFIQQRSFPSFKSFIRL